MKFWIGVASKDHVERGVAGGFCQVCHGKAAPLMRMHQGDWIIYYSSKKTFERANSASVESCQQFTAIGEVIDDAVYEFAMTPDFIPYRRNVRFLDCKAIDIRPFINELGFIKNKSRWGYAFRFGHLEISRLDFNLIASQMLGANEAALVPSLKQDRFAA